MAKIHLLLNPDTNTMHAARPIRDPFTMKTPKHPKFHAVCGLYTQRRDGEAREGDRSNVTCSNCLKAMGCKK